MPTVDTLLLISLLQTLERYGLLRTVTVTVDPRLRIVVTATLRLLQYCWLVIAVDGYCGWVGYVCRFVT